MVNKIIKATQASAKNNDVEQYFRVDLNAMTDEEALDLVRTKLS